jgi:dihydrofolate reductase
MGKLVVSTQMTVEGVIDQSDGWFMAEGEHEEHGFDQLFAADALLLGRKTYDGLAAVWPNITDTSGFAERMNSLPKFVASRTLEEPLKWNATLIKGDLAESVPRLRRQHGGNQLSYGCGELAYQLVRYGLPRR